jgi:hypothetical protein
MTKAESHSTILALVLITVVISSPSLPMGAAVFLGLLGLWTIVLVLGYSLLR